jgi:DNA-binding LacI/PurR family transcriptional regulator
MDKPITLKMLAEELGVTPMTVSKALRGEGNISQEMIFKVKKLAAEWNYQPNYLAKSLKSSKTKTLGLIISDSSMYLIAQMIEDIDRIASEHGYNIILSNVFANAEKEKRAIKTLFGKRIDGLLLVASLLTEIEHKDYLDSFGIPYVFIVRQPEFDANYVVNDNHYGAKQIVDYLIKTNNKEIYFINIPNNIPAAGERLAGYRDSLNENGIGYNEKLITECKATIHAGYSCMKQLLFRGSVKAVFCGCDLIAIGAMECLKEAGLKIPEDVKVASYDDIELAEYLMVPLTTVRQPMPEIGKIATEMLIEKIENGSNQSVLGGNFNIIVKPQLIIRKSS